MNPLALVTQDEVFRSFKQNLSQSGYSESAIIGCVAGAIGLILLLAFFNRQNNRKAKAKAVNHYGKLVKELLKKLPLRPAEVKQLRLLADSENAQAEENRPRIENPLVLILCPSLLARAIQHRSAKVDKKLVAGLAIKMGLVARPAAKMGTPKQ